MSQERFSSYLDRTHTRTTHPAVVDYLFGQVMDSCASTVSRITRGETNEVYEVGTSTGSLFMVRISRNGSYAFDHERWAAHNASRIGIRAPEYLFVAGFKDGENCSLAILPKIEGEIVDIWDTSVTDDELVRYKPVVAQAGEELRRIHSIPATGFGPLNGQGEGPYETLYDRLAMQFAAAEEYDRDLSSTASRALERVSKSLPTTPPILIHGDFGPKHFVVADGRLDGILDWGNVEGGTPEMDFARWNFYYRDRVPVAWLREGYDRDAEGVQSMPDQPILELFWGVKSFLHYAQNGHEDQLLVARERLEGPLAALAF